MRNERGFFNIIGLCLLLAMALLITGVQEFEANYTRGAINYRMETELKNAAESALIEAVKIAYEQKLNPPEYAIIEIEVNPPHSDRLKNFKAQAFLQRQKFNQFNRIYPTLRNPKNNVIENSNTEGKIFIAVASCENRFMEGKAYKRALAFVTDGTIHFVNDL